MHNAVHHNFVPTCCVMDPRLRGYSDSILLVSWQEVSESGSIYSRLWKFGLRMMRCREWGLYEATDILLGDHLNGKSTDVHVDMPHTPQGTRENEN